MERNGFDLTVRTLTIDESPLDSWLLERNGILRTEWRRFCEESKNSRGVKLLVLLLKDTRPPCSLVVTSREEAMIIALGDMDVLPENMAMAEAHSPDGDSLAIFSAPKVLRNVIRALREG